MMKKISKNLLFFFFFLSGFSALVYEIVWARQLGLVFGNTVQAIATILTVFFAGLALGSLVLGWLVDRKKTSEVGQAGCRKTSEVHQELARKTSEVSQVDRRINSATPKKGLAHFSARPLTLYGLLELGIGIYAGLTPFLFKLIETLQISFWQNNHPTKSGFSFLTFIFCFLGLIIPTFLMGGTLPVITRFFIGDQKGKIDVVGKLYGLNTLGAVLGAFLAGFWLIPSLGVKETIWVAAGINLFVGGVVLCLTRMETNEKRILSGIADFNPRRIKTNKNNLPIRLDSRLILTAFFLAGFAALALEVLWTRILILTFGSSTYAFATILTVFLLGIALGSFLASKFLLERKNLLLWLIGLEIILGVMVILLTPLLGRLPLFSLRFYQQTSGLVTHLQIAFIFSFLIVFLPTLIMGAVFPLVVKIYGGERLSRNELRYSKVSSNVGIVYAVNTLGGILGSLAAGFGFISLFGLQRGVVISGLIYFLAGILILTVTSLSKKVKTGIIVGLVLFSASAFYLPAWNKDILSSGVFVYFQDYLEVEDARSEIEAGELLYFKEGLSATVSVKKVGDDLFMRIDGKTDASTGDQENFLLTGHLPVLLHPEPKDVLVVGLGSGITLGAVEQHPVEKIDLVEIEPAVIEAAKFFSDFNHQSLDDERLNIFVQDGRYFLLTTNKTYDVISSQPSNPWVAGNANLFTQEYFQLAASKLNTNGLMLQWIQIYNLSLDDLRTVIATFQSVFPYVSAWVPPFADDLLLVGTLKPLKIDLQALDERIKEEKIQTDLDESGIREAANLLGYFVASEGKLSDFARDVKKHTDNQPILEFSAPFSLGQETIGQNLEAFLEIQEEPDFFLTEASATQKQKIKANLDFKNDIFKGKIAFANGNLGEVIGFFLEALEIDSDRTQLKNELAQIYFYQAEEFFKQQDFDQAKEVLIKSAQLNPDHPLVYLNLGAIYYQEGNLEAAEKEWQKAYELDPERPEIKENLKLLEKVRNK